MPKTSVSNETSKMLCLYLEPLGTDHWLRPGEEFTIVVDSCACPPEENPFSMIVHQDGVSVCVNVSATVTDRDGNEIPCGHQRPSTALV